jgi:hypothetical protein
METNSKAHRFVWFPRHVKPSHVELHAACGHAGKAAWSDTFKTSDCLSFTMVPTVLAVPWRAFAHRSAGGLTKAINVDSLGHAAFPIDLSAKQSGELHQGTLTALTKRIQERIYRENRAA